MPADAESSGNQGISDPARNIADTIRNWPPGQTLAVVCGGGPAWTTTTIAAPIASLRIDHAGARWIGRPGASTPFTIGRGPLKDLHAALAWGQTQCTGGWTIALSYELGDVLEPAAARRNPRGDSWPLIELQRCEDVYEFDQAGQPCHHSRRQPPAGSNNLNPAAQRSPPPPATPALPFTLGPLQSQTGRDRYESAVNRALEYIRAGDVYQVNLAHRLHAPFSGNTRAAFAALLESAHPWHGAYLELHEGSQHRALLSASPELFLKLEGPRVTTRPMKGTRSAATDASLLRHSGKDRAELNMIIDLMRNDLGRVCRFGTVRVQEAQAIELHGASLSPDGAAKPSANHGVWQGVGTVTGELREGLDLVDLLAAAFPAGSITGAPKIRAMQIIDELEPSPRGPYCGSIGWIGDDGRACLNVAIRTASVRGSAGREHGEVVDGEISYNVGAGIVAESEPRREWEETMEKARVLFPLRRL